MRTKQRIPDYGAISRRSIQNDFKRVQRYPEREKRPQIENLPFTPFRPLAWFLIGSFAFVLSFRALSFPLFTSLKRC